MSSCIGRFGFDPRTLVSIDAKRISAPRCSWITGMRTQTRICSCDCTRRLIPRPPWRTRSPRAAVGFLRGYRDLGRLLATRSAMSAFEGQGKVDIEYHRRMSESDPKRTSGQAAIGPYYSRRFRPSLVSSRPFRASTAADRQLGARSLPTPRRGSGIPS